MNKEIKERWVAALRSGEYKQGYSALEKNDTFCCLGVLCKLASDESIVEREYKENEHLVYYGGSTGYLPPEVTAWADLDTYNPEVVMPSSYGDGRTRSLSSVNDTTGYTFDNIADLIEEQL